MKKCICMVMSVLVLLGAFSALASESLYTFSGIAWDTPKSEFLSVAAEKTVVAFEEYANETYHEGQPTFEEAYGFYSVFGLPVHPNSYDSGISVIYERSEAFLNGEAEWKEDAAWTLDRIEITGAEQRLRVFAESGTVNPMDYELAQEVLNNMTNRYGAPTMAYIAYDEDWYTVSPEEIPYLANDAFDPIVSSDAYSFTIYIIFNNVLFAVDASLPASNRYGNDASDLSMEISIIYKNRPYTAEDIAEYSYYIESADAFPFVDGSISYIVVEP
ncbi:MAG: hypothetical protein IKJ65_02295 [Clostridia bacterium]|nr:hypothetical protein [Clostridia bacterium]